ncbi:MAG: NAD(P)/FAD-dependent oxidoreductase [Eubacteriaceae bacterium]|jgi:2,4-dienoyl-CoA reductase-like NADH-dependent reductase (Old Yellow Enzyme family)/thioredoxin reductase|nr:NAD(P)/FAD-dependent oxidoreductase [Eubacteriaceae bacterium]
MSNYDFKESLSPIDIGGMKVRNRFVVPPMGTNFADENGFVTDKLINYYTARAKGGFGLIILEVTAVHPGGRSIPNEVGVWDDEHIEGLKRLTESVHRYGAKICLQLHHAGRQTSEETTGSWPVAPSAVSCPMLNIIPKELTNQECWDLIEDFGDGARRAMIAGFDAVEVHGAHGYLIGQFMSAHSNKRMDEFGGDLQSRMRFPLEVMRNIRSKVGNGFPVLFRMSTRELVQDGVDIEQAKAISRMMVSAGVNAIHASLCTYGSLEWMSVPAAVPGGFNAFAAGEIKKAVDVPVIAVGKINDPYLVESIISSGEADLCALGRESLADPEIPNKVASGRIDEICPCIACEQSCHAYLDLAKPICCLANPLLGKEETLPAAAAKKKVVIVGAGPAGLESAWRLAKSGHDVTLFEKQELLGGTFRIAGLPPTKQEIIRLLKYWIRMCNVFGVKIISGKEITAEEIIAEKADAVILATGSKPISLPISGMDNPKFLQPADILEGKKNFGKNVLICGGGMIGVETAEFIAERRSSVTVIDMLPDWATDLHAFVRAFLIPKLKDEGVQFIGNAKITEFMDDGVKYDNKSDTVTLNGFDSVVLAMGTVSNNPLEKELKNKVSDLYVIGDASRAGTANKATEEALEIVRKING